MAATGCPRAAGALGVLLPSQGLGSGQVAQGANFSAELAKRLQIKPFFLLYFLFPLKKFFFLKGTFWPWISLCPTETVP